MESQNKRSVSYIVDLLISGKEKEVLTILKEIQKETNKEACRGR